jgi:hypothetical protein
MEKSIAVWKNNFARAVPGRKNVFAKMVMDVRRGTGITAFPRR